jgi:hypothetical protein
MTVAGLLASTSSRELAEWEAHFRLKAEDDADTEVHAELRARARSKLESRPRMARGKR